MNQLKNALCRTNCHPWLMLAGNDGVLTLLWRSYGPHLKEMCTSKCSVFLENEELIVKLHDTIWCMQNLHKFAQFALAWYPSANEQEGASGKGYNSCSCCRTYWDKCRTCRTCHTGPVQIILPHKKTRFCKWWYFTTYQHFVNEIWAKELPDSRKLSLIVFVT